jgi:tRNA nucleotidyltransferase (CCA-adding enzyme)
MADLLPADLELVAALPPGSLFAVGGRVRDELRSERDGERRIAKDLDYVVVGVEFDDLLRRLQRLGPANVVGASFAVVKVVVGGTSVDVALPRRERSTGSGHRAFQIESGPGIPLADDLGRRDFRINMIARALPAGDIIDPYAGRADIDAARIDILRDEAFVEDPLRMLRACQFAARFEYAVTARTLAAMRSSAELVTTVSAERIRDELLKLVTLAPRPSVGLEVMREAGLLEFVLPELAEGIGVEQNVYHAYDVYSHNLASVDATGPGDTVLRFATLLHDVGKPRTKDGPHFYGHETVGAEMTRDVLERLRFPSDEIAHVETLVRNHMYTTGAEQKDGAVRRFIRRVGVDQLPRQFALRHADIAGSGLPKRGLENEAFEARVAELLERRPPLSERDLDLSGTDVIAELVSAGKLPPGSRGGPSVGFHLRQLLEAVCDDPALNERAKLIALLRDSLAAASHKISRADR